MKFERTKNAKRNVIWSWLNRILTLLIPFAMRTIILYTLGNLYLGLGSLFSSILQVLNLAELGVGSALAFAMYKPAAEDNTAELKVLLNLYKKTYTIIGIIIAVVGIALMPFLTYFISGEIPSDINLYVLYAIYLATTVSSYWFFAYKGSILTVYQRNDISEKINIITNIVMYGIQIAGLYIYKSYYAYVIANLITTIVKNFIISIVVSKLYPELKPNGKPSKELTKFVFKKTGAVMGHKVGGVVMNSVDNILISAILGLTIVAQYNNYYYVLTAVMGFISTIFTSLTPIIGNYLIRENKEKSYNLFKILLYANSFILSICSCCFISMYQPFIELWVKKENIMPFLIVILLTVDFVTKTFRMPMLAFKDGAGLWEKDLPKPWLQVIVDLIIDIWLLNTIGIYGAIISTIVATFGVAYFYESYAVHKFCFEKKQKDYFLLTILYCLAMAVACLITYYVCNLIKFDNLILNLVVYFFASIFIGSVTFIILTLWTKSFKISFDFAKNKLSRKK